jgi:hypothetical protein
LAGKTGRQVQSKGLTEDYPKIFEILSLFASFTFLGIFLVSLGTAAGLLATYRFRKTEKQIMEDTYQPSIVADILVAILLASIGILLVIYLINSTIIQQF